MNNQSRIAILALILLAVISTNLTRMAAPPHGDPRSMVASTTMTFDPMPHQLGVDAAIPITTRHTMTLGSIRRRIRVDPQVPIRIAQCAPCHYLIMPRRVWPANTRMTVTDRDNPRPFRFVTDDERVVSIDLTTQSLTAWEEGHAVRTMPVSTGAAPNWSTPTGTFWIYRRVLDDHMVGGRPGGPDHWNVEHVPYAQYFRGAVAIHGAWWNHHFGRAISHGCVQLPTDRGPQGATGEPADARWLWHFTDIGTPVVVTGHTPPPTATTKAPKVPRSPNLRGPISARFSASCSR